jgi:DNA-binding HxlR family transcriptional regulator
LRLKPKRYVLDVTCQHITHTSPRLFFTMELKVSGVLSAVADDASLELFKLIAGSSASSEVLRGKITLTRKQYYSRLYRLTQSGLVKRKNNAYSLTVLGKVLYDAQATIENALSNYWKIKAIHSLAPPSDISAEEQKKLVKSPIRNGEIKGILAK